MLMFGQFYVYKSLSQVIAGLHRLFLLNETDEIAASEFKVDGGVALIQIVTVLSHPLSQRI